MPLSKHVKSKQKQTPAVAASKCTDGKAHSFRPAVTGNSYAKPYYEKLRIEERVEEYSDYPYKLTPNGIETREKDYDAKPVKRTHTVRVTVDDEPGNHYATMYCTKCATTREVLVKSHGEKYREQMDKLSEQERQEMYKSDSRRG